MNKIMKSTTSNEFYETSALGKLKSPLQLPSALDLDEVLTSVSPYWDQLRNRSILITGGTGIIGKWLLASLLHADNVLNLGVKIGVLSRSPSAFKAAYPDLADNRVSFFAGDVRTFDLPEGLEFSHVIHAATDVVAESQPFDIIDTCFTGTRQTLIQAIQSKTERFLLLSSGAVYGKTPPEVDGIREDFSGAISCLAPESAYAEGKRSAELLCAIENSREEISISIARCFAMIGPYVPLDKHFALGNFIDSALRNEPIHIRGDGTPVRSYLYMSDVVQRLWLLLFKGRGGVAYNVGGEEPITISDLANRVVKVLNSNVPIHIANAAIHGVHANKYYPDTNLIKHEFNLGAPLGLDEAVLRTANWYRAGYSSQK